MKKTILTIVIFGFLATIGTVLAYTSIPTACQDSDGNCQVSNIQFNDEVYESVNIKTAFPYGFIKALQWNHNLPSDVMVNGTIHVKWKNYPNRRGAGNQYVSYYQEGQWMDCAGPFGDSGITNTYCGFVMSGSDFNNIQVMIRGEDLDGLAPVFLLVDVIELTYHTIEENLSTMHVGDISLSAEVKIRGKKNKFCKVTATIPILDNSDTGVKGASVFGRWSGAFSESISDVTNYIGEVTFTTSWVKGCGTFTFTVDDVVKTGWVYDPSLDVETSDSITV
jgi:hypothetical protein